MELKENLLRHLHQHDNKFVIILLINLHREDHHGRVKVRDDHNLNRLSTF